MQALFSVLFVGLALSAPVVQAAEVVSIDWSPSGLFERELQVPAGKFAEVCGALAAPSTVVWAFQADAPTDFNVHFHVGQQVTYPARLMGVAQASASLQVDAPREYCWMWTNKTPKDVRLQLTMKQAR